MEEMIISANLDSAEAALKENNQPPISSFERIKERLIDIARVAYGSGITEKENGGEGLVGWVGGRWVKFNTRKSERANFEQHEQYDKMLTASKDAKQHMLELASSIVQGFMLKGGRIKGAPMGKRADVKEVHAAVIKFSDSYKKQTDGLSRNQAADMVNFLCRSIKKLTGVDIKDEVWGAAAKLARKTKFNEDTRARFLNDVRITDRVTDAKQNLAGAVVAAATEAAKRTVKIGTSEQLPPRSAGTSEGFVNLTTNFNPNNADSSDFVSETSWYDCLRYDRLNRIHNVVDAMVDTVVKAFPDSGLEEFLSYKAPEGVRSSKYAESEFCRRLMSRRSRDVFEQECDKRGLDGMSKKNYEHILKKLRDHFRGIAYKDNDEISADRSRETARATARELCHRIVLFLDSQISDSGMEVADVYQREQLHKDRGTNNHNVLEFAKLDDYWKQSLELKFNAMKADREYEQNALWQVDYRRSTNTGGALVELIPNAAQTLVTMKAEFTEYLGDGMSTTHNLPVVKNTHKDLARKFLGECAGRLLFKPESAASEFDALCAKLLRLRDTENDDRAYRLSNGNETRTGLQCKKEALLDFFNKEILDPLQIDHIDPPEAHEVDSSSTDLKVRKDTVDDLGKNADQDISSDYLHRSKVWDEITKNCEGKDYRAAFACAINFYSEHAPALKGEYVNLDETKFEYLDVLEKMEKELRECDVNTTSASVLRGKLEACLTDNITNVIKNQLAVAFDVVEHIYGSGKELKLPKRQVSLKVDYKDLSSLGSERLDVNKWQGWHQIDATAKQANFDEQMLLAKVRDWCRGKPFVDTYAFLLDYASACSVGWRTQLGDGKMRAGNYLYALRIVKRYLENTDMSRTNAAELTRTLNEFFDLQEEAGALDKDAVYSLKQVLNVVPKVYGNSQVVGGDPVQMARGLPPITIQICRPPVQDVGSQGQSQGAVQQPVSEREEEIVRNAPDAAVAPGQEGAVETPEQKKERELRTLKNYLGQQRPQAPQYGLKMNLSVNDLGKNADRRLFYQGEGDARLRKDLIWNDILKNCQDMSHRQAYAYVLNMTSLKFPMLKDANATTKGEYLDYLKDANSILANTSLGDAKSMGDALIAFLSKYVDDLDLENEVGKRKMKDDVVGLLKEALSCVAEIYGEKNELTVRPSKLKTDYQLGEIGKGTKLKYQTLVDGRFVFNMTYLENKIKTSCRGKDLTEALALAVNTFSEKVPTSNSHLYDGDKLDYLYALAKIKRTIGLFLVKGQWCNEEERARQKKMLMDCFGPKGALDELQPQLKAVIEKVFEIYGTQEVL